MCLCSTLYDGQPSPCILPPSLLLRNCVVWIADSPLTVLPTDVSGDRYVQSGSWDSIHVVEATEAENKASATYKLTTTIILSMNVDKAEVGETLWSGTLTRQAETSGALNESKTHFHNIGRMIEDMETDMRSNLNEIYIMKTREIVNSIRSTKTGPSMDASHVASLNAAVMGHGKTRAIDSEA